MVIGCSILLLSLLLVVLQGNKKGVITIQKGPKPNEVANNATPVVKTEGANKEGASAIDPMLEYFSIQSDASNVPWTPPSVGAPYSTEMLPPGLEAVLFLKQELVAGQESASSSAVALSNWWSSVYPSTKSSGTAGLLEFSFVVPKAFNTVAVGWYPGASVGTYHNVFRWSRKDPGPLSSMLNDLESWKSNTLDVGSKKHRYWTKDFEGRTYAAVSDDFSSQAEDQVKRLTIGPLELLKPLFESEGKSGPLRRQLDSLLQSTDSRAQARCVRRCERSSTIVFKPCYAACISNPNFTWNTEHLGMTCKAQLAMRSTFERNLPKLPTQWKVSLRSNLQHPIGVRSRTVSHKCSEHCTSTLDPVLKTAKSSSTLIFLKSLL